MNSLASTAGSFRVAMSSFLAIMALPGLLPNFAAPAAAAIITTGNVTPDPNTTTSNTTLYVANTSDGTMAVDGGSTVSSGTSYVGYTQGVHGTVTITDSNSKWTTSSLYVGYNGVGTLNINNGAAVSSSSTTLGESATVSGTLNVTDTSSHLSTGHLEIGVNGGGQMFVSSGGIVDSTSADIDGGPSQTSNVTISGAQSVWNNTGDMHIGSQFHPGILDILQGGTVNTRNDLLVSDTSSANSLIEFDNGTLNTDGLLSRVTNLHGTGTVNTHGMVLDVNLVYDQDNGLQQQIVLSDGAIQNITINLDTSSAGSLGAGFSGQGSMTVADGVAITSKNGYLGYQTGSNGVATIDGSGSKWSMTGGLNVGYSGTGVLTIKNSGAVQVSGTTTVGTGASSITFDNGVLTTKSLIAGANQLSGAGTINTHGIVSDIALAFDSTHPLQQQVVLTSQPNQNVTINLDVDGSGIIGAGARGVGSLAVADGINLVSAAGYLGYGPGAIGTATVTGTGSKWSSGGVLYIGSGGQGNLTIADGANVTDSLGRIWNGKVTVTGSGSSWTNTSDLDIGNFGSSASCELLINNGGRVTSTSFQPGITNSGIGAEFLSSGKVTVDGVGSTWVHTGSLTVGGQGTGRLIVSGGGAVTSGNSVLGATGNSLSSSATITGAGSDWSTSALTVGSGTPASLTVSAGGTVSSATSVVGASFTGNSTANISGQGSTWIMTGGLTVGSSSSLTGGGTVIIGTGGVVSVAGNTLITSRSRINLQGGSFTTNSISTSFSGVFSWMSGLLHVGTYSGSLTNFAGILSPGQSPGQTTITGSYTQQSGATLQMEIGGTTPTTQYDFVSVGSATLGGTLQVSLLNGFLPAPTDTFTILGVTSSGGSLTGSFSNVGNGKRLATADGAGSFLVYFGTGSIYNAKQVVLTGFQPVPEPSAEALVGACALAILFARRKQIAGAEFVNN